MAIILSDSQALAHLCLPWLSTLNSGKTDTYFQRLVTLTALEGIFCNVIMVLSQWPDSTELREEEHCSRAFDSHSSTWELLHLFPRQNIYKNNSKCTIWQFECNSFCVGVKELCVRLGCRYYIGILSSKHVPPCELQLPAQETIIWKFSFKIYIEGLVFWYLPTTQQYPITVHVNCIAFLHVLFAWCRRVLQT